MDKRAILAVSFGTSHLETLDRNITAIEREIEDSFPNFTVRRAFTSSMIINKLRQREGLLMDTVETALKRLVDDDFRIVVIQPTHIINGLEYEKITSAAAAYKGKFDSLIIGAPLLSQTDDYKKVTAILEKEYGDYNEAVVFLGHGTSHYSDSAYAALDYHFKAKSLKFFVGTVEGYPDLETVCAAVKRSGIESVLLVPFMVVAGDHAINDMAGEEDDSWKSIFTKNSLNVSCVIKGLGEYRGIRRLYVEHIEAAINGAI